jgi:hypothetical protein
MLKLCLNQRERQIKARENPLGVTRVAKLQQLPQLLLQDLGQLQWYVIRVFIGPVLTGDVHRRIVKPWRMQKQKAPRLVVEQSLAVIHATSAHTFDTGWY